MKYINMLARGEYMDNVELWEAFDNIAQELGCEEFLNALAKAMGMDQLKDNMEYIIRCYELADQEEEEEEDI